MTEHEKMARRKTADFLADQAQERIVEEGEELIRNNADDHRFFYDLADSANQMPTYVERVYRKYLAQERIENLTNG